ncbi:hypothetical protein AGABI1DRAFT_108941 [Agaricus bisporus var. burnettii JB137-S8]|uniref:Uncharacterized protein n=1 Tax=Agaricus bisporus var. burnettii (strain JB137-S8 / ATCC MYA-4627 / FGSC 10392) TaxID=597362 RepID=K5WZD5_AGABU|nr:uncharacterized protein AGABI1DRAFT_108941 [Agaricus bisporus var. burnettii JB137-S8]EKM76188.1 hypothetical protein AGABI1DRAFT_108941 [Agaricus bisporus var. burnettii JB137-S8]
MPIFSAACITGHTTSSKPHPHVLYNLKVTFDDGTQQNVHRRYSEFVTLHTSFRDPFHLPAKHSLTTNLVPSAWLNDELIAERKEGLETYLHNLLRCYDLQDHPLLVQFLTPGLFYPFGTPQTEPGDPVANMESKSLLSVNVSPDRSHEIYTRSEAGEGLARHSEPLAAAYYPSWAADTLSPEKIAYTKFDIIFFCFITPNGVAGIDWDDGSKNVLRRLVAAARAGTNQTRIAISMGGWAGCHWMSRAMSTASNRAKLCDNIDKIIDEYGLDGIDIDWVSLASHENLMLNDRQEYPNDSGAGNPHSPADAANLLSFIKTLRDILGPTRIISAAVTHLPWKGPDGKPLPDVSEFARCMNFVNIIIRNYDVFIASDEPGPNAPLENGCGSSSQPEASARAAYTQWTNAGMPAWKLLLGLPLYGYVSRSTAKKLSGSSFPYARMPMFPAFPHPHYPYKKPETVTAPAGDLSAMWGQQISFKDLLSYGALVKKSDGTYDGANGYTKAWDDCSDTPFLFNQSRRTVITFDDTYSLMDKAKFARESKMAGCFTWSLDQDDGTALQNVIRVGLGKK